MTVIPISSVLADVAKRLMESVRRGEGPENFSGQVLNKNV